MTNSQPVPKQWLWNAKLSNFANFTNVARLMKKIKLSEKFELPDKRGFELTETREKDSFLPPGQPPFLNCLRYGIFPLASLGCLPGCAPSQLLHPCSSAEYEKLEKVLDFLATTKNISVIDSLLVLNPKHSSYWQKN